MAKETKGMGGLQSQLPIPAAIDFHAASGRLLHLSKLILEHAEQIRGCSGPWHEHPNDFCAGAEPIGSTDRPQTLTERRPAGELARRVRLAAEPDRRGRDGG